MRVRGIGEAQAGRLLAVLELSHRLQGPPAEERQRITSPGDGANLLLPRAQIKVATRPFAMNPRGGPMNLSDEQASSVAAYIWSISREKTAAARTQQLP
jgi:hypothetical protein